MTIALVAICLKANQQAKRFWQHVA